MSETKLESIAKVLIINEKNEALVLTIGEYEGHPEKSFTPDLPGGRIEIAEHETEQAGALREVEEETGIVLEQATLVLGYSGTKFYPEESKSVSRFLYTARLDHTPEVVVSWEHADSEWVPVGDLLEKKTFRTFYKEGIEYLVSHRII